MDVTTLYSIGDLSRRTGLSVRTIRFYSDSGVVAPTTRSPAGYRLYDLDALLRLELVRTLRELGMDLATVQQVLERELSVAEVAATHADALDVQIRMLQLNRSVLRVVDLAIVVCAATNSDLERMEELPMDNFIAQIAPKRSDKSVPETWVLLCRVQPGTTVVPQGLRRQLTASGWKVFDTEIPAIQKYASTGEGVSINAKEGDFADLVSEMERRGLISK